MSRAPCQKFCRRFAYNTPFSVSWNRVYKFERLKQHDEHGRVGRGRSKIYLTAFLITTYNELSNLKKENIIVRIPRLRNPLRLILASHSSNKVPVTAARFLACI